MINITKYRKDKKYCECGCGKLVKCEGHKYASGHNPKVQFKKGNNIRNTSKTRFKKGYLSNKKNKTYEELYGKERAKKIKKDMSKNRKKAYLEGKLSNGKKGQISWNKGMSGDYIIPSTRGKNHWNWKGGVTSPTELLRLKSKWKIWRELIFNRDNFTCQNPNCKYCGNKRGGIELHPHHIKPIVLFPELVFRIDNGITYCKDFHLKGGLHRGLRIKNG